MMMTLSEEGNQEGGGRECVKPRNFETHPSVGGGPLRSSLEASNLCRRRHHHHFVLWSRDSALSLSLQEKSHREEEKREGRVHCRVWAWTAGEISR